MANTAVALAKMKQSGMRVTKQRRDLITFLGAHADSYVPVTELDTYMRRQYPGLSHDTIYRNVKAFSSLGILESDVQDEQTNVKLQCDFQHPHHHHFICTSCHRVQEIKLCPLDGLAQQLPGAEITGHNFELYGLCADCTKAVKMGVK